jgi:alpha-1,2-mannosyltransferase
VITETTPEHHNSISPWVRRCGPAVAAASLLTYVAVYLHWHTLRLQIDAMVYRFAAERLLAGLDLYSTGFTGKPNELLFIYPPFAAIGAIPLAMLDRVTVQFLWLLGMVAALTYAVVRMLKSAGMQAGAGLFSLTALLVGVIAWLEPVRLTAELGQINLVLLVLVVADLLATKHSRWAGVGIGLAAGIKLTPALFIVYLLVTRRVRAALVATGTFAATVGLGFAVAPSDSVAFWLHGRFDDVNRISHDPLANTSVRGLFLRMHWSPMLATIVAVAVAAVAIVIAAIAYRRGQSVLAVAVVGMASAAASPFSWSHHWVWFAPLVVHLGYHAYVRGGRVASAAMWLVCAIVGGWFVSVAGDTPQAGVMSLRLGGKWDEIMPATYVFVFVAVLVCTAVWLWRERGRRLTRSPTHDLEHLKGVDTGGDRRVLLADRQHLGAVGGTQHAHSPYPLGIGDGPVHHHLPGGQ